MKSNMTPEEAIDYCEMAARADEADPKSPTHIHGSAFKEVAQVIRDLQKPKVERSRLVTNIPELAVAMVLVALFLLLYSVRGAAAQGIVVGDTSVTNAPSPHMDISTNKAEIVTPAPSTNVISVAGVGVPIIMSTNAIWDFGDKELGLLYLNSITNVSTNFVNIGTNRTAKGIEIEQVGRAQTNRLLLLSNSKQTNFGGFLLKILGKEERPSSYQVVPVQVQQPSR